MSIWATNGRNESDLFQEANRSHGTVAVTSLLEHCEGIIAANPGVFGDVVCTPVRTLCELLRQIAHDSPDAIDLREAEFPLQDVVLR